MHSIRIAVLLAGAALSATPAIAQDPTPAELLQGVWRLLPPDRSETNIPDLAGQIVFSDAGTMSVQAMHADADLTTPYMVNGYEAFHGTYVVDEAEGTFVVTVSSSLVRDLIGQDLERAFAVTADRLTLTPTNPEESWRVVYERL